jgi:glycosyltransferase involved in cell wall biosynthesis
MILKSSEQIRANKPCSEGEKFSVLASLYIKSKPEDFDRCMRSIVDQTLRPAEVVIVLDGPVDRDVRSLIQAFRSKLPIQTLELQHNQGLGRALAAGLEACQYDLVARVDTDDVSVPTRFEKQVSYFRDHDGLVALGGGMRENYVCRGKILSRDRWGAHGKRGVTWSARRRNPVNHPTVMFRKIAISSVGGYVDCPFFEDYYLWARLLLANYQIENLEEILVETEVDDEFFNRRGGWRYLLLEIKFLMNLYRLKFLAIHHVFLSVILRAPLRLAPKGLRKFVYMGLLRN